MKRNLVVMRFTMAFLMLFISCSNATRKETQEEKDRMVIKAQKVHKMVGIMTSCDSSGTVFATEMLTFDEEGFQTSVKVFYGQMETLQRHQTFKYNSVGDMIESKDELTGIYNKYEYDETGQKTRSESYLSNGILTGSESFDWSDEKLITTTFDADGKELSKKKVSINDQGHITSYSAYKISYEYDSNGRIAEQTRIDERSGQEFRTENSYENNLLAKRVMLENKECKSVITYTFERFD